MKEIRWSAYLFEEKAILKLLLISGVHSNAARSFMSVVIYNQCILFHQAPFPFSQMF